MAILLCVHTNELTTRRECAWQRVRPRSPQEQRPGFLGVSENHVRDLERNGTLPATKTSGGMRLFVRERVEELARVRESRSK